jgi:cytochrome c-type biogenesis protein CcmH
MTLFVSLAAALIVVGLTFLLLPLLRARRVGTVSEREANLSIYRDQFAELERDLASGVLTEDQHAQARVELEQRLLADVERAPPASPPAKRSSLATAIVLAIAVPVLSGLLYWHLGTPQALNAPTRAQADPSNMTAEHFQQMTDKLAARLQQKPDDPVGWTMLGRAYKALERYPEAVDALSRALKLRPQDPEILVEYAEALGLARGGDLKGEPSVLLERALKIAPDDPKVLTLAGTAAFARGDYKVAIALWQRLSSKVPPESEMGQALASGIAEAKARQTGKRAQPTPAPKPPQAAAASGKALSGTVNLAPSLQGRAEPGDTVFIFARAAEGPPMPLAVMRKQVKDLPFEFKLDDSMAMRPGLELSAFPKVVVTARVSKSGNARPAPGDLEGASAPVAPGAKGIAVLIDKQVP